MKQQLSLTFVLGALAVCLFSGASCKTVYYTFKIPYDTNQLIGAWIGFIDTDAARYFMILQEHGKGVLYSQFHNEPAVAFRIVTWGLEDDAVICHFLRTGPPTNPALFKCPLKTGVLDGMLVGMGGWTEHVTFWQQSFVEKSLENLNALER